MQLLKKKSTNNCCNYLGFNFIRGVDEGGQKSQLSSQNGNKYQRFKLIFIVNVGVIISTHTNTKIVSVGDKQQVAVTDCDENDNREAAIDSPNKATH